MSIKQTAHKMTKKIVVRFIIISLILSGILYLQFYMRRASTPQLLGKAVRSVDVQEKVIALTFDDGPNSESTETILNLLDEYNAKATFFTVGMNVEKYPEIIEKIMTTGVYLSMTVRACQLLCYQALIQ